ncbi:MAG: hypothetical protein FD156_391 [Nitrospirae bacterium]|nr:MAG: hypothetical protein FD156_391 [Nitrospirota bacterium]
MSGKDNILDKLLSNYCFWSLAAIGSFIILVSLFLAAVFIQRINFLMLVMVLLFGFLWIGATSISRHSFVLLKRYIGREGEISILEFLSTQLVVFLFPFAYRKVKKEAELYRKKNSAD